MVLMATKFVLSGGVITRKNEGIDFLNEAIKGFKEPVKMLNCLFARKEKDWEKFFEEDKEFYAERIKDRKFILELADPENFAEQVKRSDVIYLRGGDTEKLLQLLKKNLGWIKFLDGKTVAGTSAGTDAVVRFYSDLDGEGVSEGLGLLDIKTIVHWKSDYGFGKIDWDKCFEELERFGEKLPTYKLGEGEFAVFEKDLIKNNNS